MNGKSMRKAAGTKLAAALSAMTIGMATIAGAAPTPEQKCEGGKNDAAGKYASCVAKAEKSYVATADAVKYAAALAKCESKSVAIWAKLEQKAVDAGTTCPSTGDQAGIQDFVDACTQSVAVAVGGGSLLLDPITCNADLAVCDSDLTTCSGNLSSTNADLVICEADLGECEQHPAAGQLQTQQTVCYTAGGAVTPCAGTGQDGELQPGVPRGYVDNGDGTITDLATGLMWEKLSDDGSIHDKDNTYIWTNAFALKISTLNTNSFGGHTDWRVPTIEELQSINSYGYFSPSVDPAFDAGCVGGCSVTACSCTVAAAYWSSTTYLGGTASAWANYFTGGLVDDVTKGTSIRVRGVRTATLPLPALIAPTLATGQTTAYGAGSDGDLEKGVSRSFVDNGDGTISDLRTGLVWEKKSDDGSVHDKDNDYTWSTGTDNLDGTIVTTFLATLNGGGGFAGHTDWRIPNVHELESLRNFGANNPAVYPAFNDSCTGGCTVTTCSCTQSSDDYWSSSTYQNAPTSAWNVAFFNGYTYASGKTGYKYVRAVRSGS